MRKVEPFEIMEKIQKEKVNRKSVKKKKDCQ